MQEKRDPFTAVDTVVDTDGKAHRVYPMKIRDKDVVVRLVEKFNDTIIFANFMIPKFEEDLSISRTEDGEQNYDDIPYNAMMKLLELSTKQTTEQLLEWVDVVSAKEVIAKYLDISQMNKKKVNLMENL